MFPMSREKLIQQIKDCGQSIIDNAEKIQNNFEYACNDLIITIDINPRAAPVIAVKREYIPENYIVKLKEQ